MIHTVIEGDSIPAIAHAAGLFPETVWDHPNNAELKALRTDMNVLFPGDRVFVPEKRPRVEMAATDKSHKFRRKGVPCRLRIQLFHVETPRANEEYEISIDGAVKKGQADAKGVVELWVPPDAKEGLLTIGPDKAVFSMKLGHMDPLTEIAGLQKRLENLGYRCGEKLGAMNDETRQALRSFQRRFNLEESGEFDGAVKALLGAFHDRNDLFPDDPWFAGA